VRSMTLRPASGPERGGVSSSTDMRAPTRRAIAARAW
jgi:hypothetical protein